MEAKSGLFLRRRRRWCWVFFFVVALARVRVSGGDSHAMRQMQQRVSVF